MSGADILTCLLVDDDELFREGLLRAIRGLRLPLEMKFMQAGSGEEALKKVAVEMPSLVFLDYRMPGLSGLECLRKMQEEYPELPVIMVTGEGDERVAVEAMKAGAMDYLVKGGVEASQLRKVIVNAVQKGEMRATIRRQREALMEAERHRVMIESLGAACHHLGQPATVIRGYLEMVQKEEMSASARAMVETCLQAADSLAEVLKALSKVSQYRTVPYLESGNDSCRILDI